PKSRRNQGAQTEGNAMQSPTRRLDVAVISASILVLAPAAGIAASRPTVAHARLYGRLYREVAQKFGKRTPGRNIIADGYGQTGRAASDAEVAASITVLRRMLAPPPVVTLTVPTSTAYSSPTSYT